MALRVTGWKKFQTTAIANITRSRTKQNARLAADGLDPLPIGRPYTMEKLLIARQFDRNFAEFARKVGPRQAETFWLRTLQFVADGHGLSGMIHVSRREFGPVVLSRRSPYRDLVSAKLGARVWDALIESGLAVEEPDALSETLSETLSESSRYSSPSPSPSPSSLRGRSLREASCDGAARGERKARRPRSEGRGFGCPDGQPRPVSYFIGDLVRDAADAGERLSDADLLALQAEGRRRAEAVRRAENDNGADHAEP